MKNKQYKIELSEKAELDFDNSYLYYAEESEKVAENFYQHINSAFENIAKNPYAFQIVLGAIRRYILKRFPFIVYYRIIEQTIQIIAIFHVSRNPEIWKQRTMKD